MTASTSNRFLRPLPRARAVAAIAMTALWMMTTGCARPTLRVASDLEHAPFIDVDEDGRPCGRDIEMMERLAEDIGASVTWVRLPFDALLPALERGEVDAVCATLGITTERSQRFLFSAPYFATTQLALVRTGPGEPETIADLRGRRVAASRGTTSADAAQRIPGADLLLDAKSNLSPPERLRTRDVDAVVMDGPDAEDFAERSGGALTVVQQPLAEELYAIALPRQSSDLKERLDQALHALQEEGWLDALDRRYGVASAALHPE